MGATKMKLDFATLAFGYNVISGGGTPNWATSLGQSRNRQYRINDSSDIHEILKGIIYSAVNPAKISISIGKGGHIVSGNAPDTPIVMGAVFSKIFVNNQEIFGAKFILVITRDTSKSHSGRLRLKYGPSNCYTDEDISYSNKECFKEIKRQMGIQEDACWFVDEINIINQDTICLKTYIVDPEKKVDYANNVELHTAWDALTGNITSVQGNEDSFITFGSNKLFYGVPGCGKSFSVDKFIEDEGIPKSFVRRVVFHPDYTYSDFVGQIMPVTKETVEGKKIEYTFIPGPFTDILKIAYENPEQKCALIIEELNRGNAPAIFGDLFQLLDREEDSSKENYQWSKYHVTNKDIAENTIFERDDSDYSVKLPPNLAILATMNTSDQNVFSMDTAFQRRWQMQHIRNEFKGEHADKFIEGTRITWKAFATTVNELLTEKSNVFGNSEDKCLGAYFAIDAELDNRQRFAEKVLKYLWDDAFKMDGTPLFDKQYTSLSKLIEDFEDATGDALKIVLNNEVYNKMLEKSETMQAQAEDVEADEVTDQE